MTTVAPTSRAAMSRGARELADHAFERLRAMTGDGAGVTRSSYGPGETAGLELIAALARDASLDVRTDAVGNLLVSLAGADRAAPEVLIGSHMDSVPCGGNFDGAAGVIAGLLCLVRLKETGVRPRRTVTLIGLRGEESAWFGTCYIGSRAIFGDLSDQDLRARHRDSGRTLLAHMQELGIDTAAVIARTRLLDPAHVAAYYELHIEQGPVLVACDQPVGIVTGIRGNLRYPAAKCIGQAGHSGTVPPWLRRDAVLATADLLHRMEGHWRRLLEQGHDVVFTAGVCTTDPAAHAVTRIPGEVTFSLDIRSETSETIAQLAALLERECAAVAQERQVVFDLGRRSIAEPARMDDGLIDRLCRICRQLDVPHQKLPSGAGHDAAVFANHGIPAAMIFIRNHNGSHNPDEAMELDDFMLGVDVLYRAIVGDAESAPR